MTANRITPEEVWRSLVCFAEAVCQEIEAHPPDVILVLYKSGSVVWRAAETWWQMTRGTPLPPVVGANIGLSKFRRYDSGDYPWQTLEYGDWDTIGRLIAWTVQHTQWLELLQHRIADAVGPAAPARILVVDDVIAEGSTAVIADSLLSELYPRVRTLIVAGMDWHWREILGEAWLSQLNPAALTPAHRHWLLEEYPRRRPDDITMAVPWACLISGLADGDASPLDWVPLTTSDSLLSFLTPWMPAEVWLQFPQWVASTATQRLLHQHQAGVNPLDTSPYNSGRPFALKQGIVPFNSYLCAMAFLKPWVTVDEAALRFDIKPSVVQDLIAECAQYDQLVFVEVDGVAGFTLGLPVLS